MREISFLFMRGQNKKSGNRGMEQTIPADLPSFRPIPSPSSSLPALPPSPTTCSMEKKKKKRRHRKLVTAALAAGILAVLFFSFHRHLSGDLLTGGGTPAPATPAAVYGIHPQYPRHHAVLEQPTAAGSSLLPLRHSGARAPSAVVDGVLLPDWEVLLLLRPDHGRPPDARLHCLFRNGAKSPATFSGLIPSSRRSTYRCALPPSVRRRPPFYVPCLVSSSSSSSHGAAAADAQQNTGPSGPELLRWNSLVYEAASTDGDVIVFAKGVNNRQGVDRPAEDLRCVFHVPGAAAAAVPAVRTAVRSSSQEVFRCLHPDERSLAPLLTASAEVGESVRVSLEIVGGGRKVVVPSVADYLPRARRPAHGKAPEEGRSLICACTMVFNVAKFLREWVVYHSRLGVDAFILYDNGSEDGLDRAVGGLRRQGYNVTSRLWLWPKTQEAAFSHCAAASRGRCEWMMYLDVDEFAFSPSWADFPAPSRDMLRSLLPPPPSDDEAAAAGDRVGQISMGCHEFGPSNQAAHPRGGVTQGYTCRSRAEQRHKSVVLLDAVDPSLHNVVHHFRLREGYRGVTVRGSGAVVVNHYKYQAWPEFKAKFRRRASAYVVDWTKEANPGSKDRTPGLGFSAVEPPGWAGRFCEVKDTQLRDVVRRWFGRRSDGSFTATGDYRMEWEETR